MSNSRVQTSKNLSMDMVFSRQTYHRGNDRSVRNSDRDYYRSGNRTGSGKSYKSIQRHKAVTPSQQNVRPSAKRRARRKRKMRIKLAVLMMEAFLVLLLLAFTVMGLKGILHRDNGEKTIAKVSVERYSEIFQNKVQGVPEKYFQNHPAWEENYLTPNEYSRPGDALLHVNNIFVHYTANKGTSALQNRSYFEQLKDTGERSASAHFIIGYDGEIVQCIPLDEVGYAVKTRNFDSISIECCYLEEDGAFTRETYNSLKELLSWLLSAYHLKPEDVLRHYDCGGKKCPLYYVEHEDAWEQLLKELESER